MFEIGRVCVKLAGRDAGKKCVIVDVIDNVYVLIDGQTRRRKCNREHLELTGMVVKLEKNADNRKVVETLKKAGIDCKEKAPSDKKDKDAKKRPTKERKAKDKPAPEKKGSEKAVKKEAAQKKETKKKTDDVSKEKTSSKKTEP